jgi:hypothetical protein
MNFDLLYEAVNKDYGHRVALATVQIMTLNLSMKIKLKDLKTPGRFESRILEKSKKVLWELSSDEYDLAVKCWKVAHDWSIRHSLQGLGGCVYLSFKELVDQKSPS